MAPANGGLLATRLPDLHAIRERGRAVGHLPKSCGQHGRAIVRGKPRNDGEPKTSAIVHRRGRWFASVIVECTPIALPRPPECPARVRRRNATLATQASETGWVGEGMVP